MAVSVLVVDDHEMMVLGIRALFHARAEVEVVGAAYDSSEALRLCGELEPQVACVDLSMPDSEVEGFDLCRVIREQSPLTRVVMFTAHVEPGVAERALLAGATGVVAKNDRKSSLVAATVLAASDRQYVSPVFASDATVSEKIGEGLSPRQLEVLRLMADGLDTRQIGEQLCVGEETVRTHVKAVQRKLGATGRTHAVAIGLRNALFI